MPGRLFDVPDVPGVPGVSGASAAPDGSAVTEVAARSGVDGLPGTAADATAPAYGAASAVGASGLVGCAARGSVVQDQVALAEIELCGELMIAASAAAAAGEERMTVEQIDAVLETVRIAPPVTAPASRVPRRRATCVGEGRETYRSGS